MDGQSRLDAGVDNWLSQAFIFMEDSHARTLFELMIAYDNTNVIDLANWSSHSYLTRQLVDLKSTVRGQERVVESLQREIQDSKMEPTKRQRGLARTQTGVLRRLSQDIIRFEKELEQMEQEASASGLTTSISRPSRSLLLATRHKIDPNRIFDCIPAKTAVIELHISRGGLIILGITQHGIEVKHQDFINDVEMRKLLFPYFRALRD
jgi:hypothetical protein